MTRVLIVDDQRTAREIMESAVHKSPEYAIVKVILDAGNAYLHCMTGQVDLILMDVYTLDGENGIQAAAKIKRDFPRIKIIIVSSMPEESFIRGAREAGCESFWYKDVSEDDLLSVMDRTMAGESVLLLRHRVGGVFNRCVKQPLARRGNSKIKSFILKS